MYNAFTKIVIAPIPLSTNFCLYIILNIGFRAHSERDKRKNAIYKKHRDGSNQTLR